MPVILNSGIAAFFSSGKNLIKKGENNLNNNRLLLKLLYYIQKIETGRKYKKTCTSKYENLSLFSL